MNANDPSRNRENAASESRPPRKVSRRELLQRSAAGLATAALAGESLAGERPRIRVDIPRRPIELIRPPVTPAVQIKVAELPAAQDRLLKGETVLPTAGRMNRGGTLFTVAGNPESPTDPNRNNNRQPGGEEGKNPNFDPNGERKDDDRRKPPYHVSLLCRTFVGDTGVRPLPPDLVFWESQDLWIEGPEGDPDRARAGVENTVKVHVWNVGMAACWAAQVDLYWCNPSVGVNAAAAHPIGSQNVSLMGGEHKVLAFKWTPVVENGGHECLVAQVYDPLSDPLTAPFNPKLDRRVGQRNVSVVPATAGQSLSFDFFVPNLSKAAATTSLTVERLGGTALRPMALGLGRQQLNAAPVGAAGLTTPQVQDARPVLDLSAVPEGSIFRETLRNTPALNQRALGNALRVLSAPGKKNLPLLRSLAPGVGGEGPARILRRDLLSPERILDGLRGGEIAPVRQATIEPGKELKVALTAAVPQEAKRGTAQVYRVVERVDGEITGGVTVVVETT